MHNPEINSKTVRLNTEAKIFVYKTLQKSKFTSLKNLTFLVWSRIMFKFHGPIQIFFFTFLKPKLKIRNTCPGSSPVPAKWFSVPWVLSLLRNHCDYHNMKLMQWFTRENFQFIPRIKQENLNFGQSDFEFTTETSI